MTFSEDMRAMSRRAVETMGEPVVVNIGGTAVVEWGWRPIGGDEAATCWFGGDEQSARWGLGYHRDHFGGDFELVRRRVIYGCTEVVQ